jgi:hypothetical protein
MRDHIAGAYGLTVSSLSPVALEPLTPFPEIRPTFDGGALAAQAQAQMRWVADEMVQAMTPLGLAIFPVIRRTAEWTTPSARQLHLDVRRFAARFMSGVTEEAFQAARDRSR